MAIMWNTYTLSCPHCSEATIVPTAGAGREFRCPYCSSNFRVVFTNAAKQASVERKIAAAGKLDGLVRGPAAKTVGGLPSARPWRSLSRRRPQTSGMAIASLVFGITSVLFLALLSICSAVSLFPLLAIIFGGVAIGKTSRDPALKGRGLAIAGLLLGILCMGAVIWRLLSLEWYRAWF